MDQLLEILRVTEIHLTPTHPTHVFWTTDVQYELLIRSDEGPNSRAKSKLATALVKVVTPILRAYDYQQAPFPLRATEELILLPDPHAYRLALRLAGELKTLAGELKQVN